MTVEELVLECQRVLDAGLEMVRLTVPGSATGERIRLDRAGRRKCPMGAVLCWHDDPPRTVALFDAIEVLAWLHARGLVVIDVQEKK